MVQHNGIDKEKEREHSGLSFRNVDFFGPCRTSKWDCQVCHKIYGSDALKI